MKTKFVVSNISHLFLGGK